MVEFGMSDAGSFDGRDWTAAEVRALAEARQAELDQCLAAAGGNRDEAIRLMTDKALHGGYTPTWHPERTEFVPGVPPWHPESGSDDPPPEGGVREPRRPAPDAPSGAEALEEPTSE